MVLSEAGIALKSDTVSKPVSQNVWQLSIFKHIFPFLSNFDLNEYQLLSRLDSSFPTLIVGIELFDHLDLSYKLYKSFYFELHFLLINIFVNDFLSIDFELSPPGYID